MAYKLKNWKKCSFLTQIEYLGYIIENGFIKPSVNKTKAVEKFPNPNNVRQIQSFLALIILYFRKFVLNYSRIASPTNLLRANVVFNFGRATNIWWIKSGINECTDIAVIWCECQDRIAHGRLYVWFWSNFISTRWERSLVSNFRRKALY